MRKTPSEQELEFIAEKFIRNLPARQFDGRRIMLHFEQAYFHFIDKYNLNSYAGSFQKSRQQRLIFFSLLLDHMDDDRLKNQNAVNISRLLQRHYKYHPVHGAIIMNEQRDKVLLVQCDFSKKYGFVKGKVKEGEKQYSCAKRQISEELGIDLKIEEEKFIEVDGKNKKGCRFYLSEIDEKKISIKKKNSKNPQQDFQSKELCSISWYTPKQVDRLMVKMQMNDISAVAWRELKLRGKIKHQVLQEMVKQQQKQQQLEVRKPRERKNERMPKEKRMKKKYIPKQVQGQTENIEKIEKKEEEKMYKQKSKRKKKVKYSEKKVKYVEKKIKYVEKK